MAEKQQVALSASVAQHIVKRARQKALAKDAAKVLVGIRKTASPRRQKLVKTAAAAVVAIKNGNELQKRAALGLLQKILPLIRGAGKHIGAGVGKGVKGIGRGVSEAGTGLGAAGHKATMSAIDRVFDVAGKGILGKGIRGRIPGAMGSAGRALSAAGSGVGRAGLKIQDAGRGVGKALTRNPTATAAGAGVGGTAGLLGGMSLLGSGEEKPASPVRQHLAKAAAVALITIKRGNQAQKRAGISQYLSKILPCIEKQSDTVGAKGSVLTPGSSGSTGSLGTAGATGAPGASGLARPPGAGLSILGSAPSPKPTASNPLAPKPVAPASIAASGMGAPSPALLGGKHF